MQWSGHHHPKVHYFLKTASFITAFQLFIYLSQTGIILFKHLYWHVTSEERVRSCSHWRCSAVLFYRAVLSSLPRVSLLDDDWQDFIRSNFTLFLSSEVCITSQKVVSFLLFILHSMVIDMCHLQIGFLCSVMAPPTQSPSSTPVGRSHMSRVCFQCVDLKDRLLTLI